MSPTIERYEHPGTVDHVTVVTINDMATVTLAAFMVLEDATVTGWLSHASTFENGATAGPDMVAGHALGIRAALEALGYERLETLVQS